MILTRHKPVSKTIFLFTVKCEPDTTSVLTKESKPLPSSSSRPTSNSYLDYNFSSYNDNNNDLMVQAKLDSLSHHHGAYNGYNWSNQYQDHYGYNKNLPPPPPLSYHNGYGTQYPSGSQNYGGYSNPSITKYPNGPQYQVPSHHSFSVNVNVMTPANPSSSQIASLFGATSPQSSVAQCVILKIF